jgi:transposase
LATKYGLHPNQISQWKRQLLESNVDVFSRNGDKEAQAQNAEQSELYEQIGRGTLWVQDGARVAEKKAAPFS